MFEQAPHRTFQDPASWLSEFEWSEGGIRVRRTDITLRINVDLIAEVASWALWFVVLGAAAMLARLHRRPRLSLWFAPQVPRPWYLARAAAIWAGVSLAQSEGEADAVCYFDDSTRGVPPFANAAVRLNFACADVSKSRVAEIFAAVFGYPLAVAPDSWRGPLVVKSEKNGVHDGRVIEGPLSPEPGCVYQRLIETADENGNAQDLRTLVAGGRPVLVWVKVKPAGRRFAIQNRRAFLRRPDEVFSAEQLANITAFTVRMGLDWGGLDILQDREDGRIYIVDVNKTDVGPVIALSWADKIRSMRILAAALRGLIDSRLRSSIRVPPPVPAAKNELAHAR
jgi:hypothetical protein